MAKINFSLPQDNKRHFYCINCDFPDNVEIKVDGKSKYKCNNCGKVLDRRIDLDPKITWWVDPNSKELWHESVGVFVHNKENKILFIERTIYPYGFTIPAGHLDKDEAAQQAACRELFEETGIKTDNLKLIFEGALADKCRKGADYHMWHLYKFLLEKDQEIITDESEGKNPVWKNVDEALTGELTSPVRYFLEKKLY